MPDNLEESYFINLKTSPLMGIGFRRWECGGPSQERQKELFDRKVHGQPFQARGPGVALRIGPNRTQVFRAWKMSTRVLRSRGPAVDVVRRPITLNRVEDVITHIRSLKPKSGVVPIRCPCTEAPPPLLQPLPVNRVQPVPAPVLLSAASPRPHRRTTPDSTRENWLEAVKGALRAWCVPPGQQGHLICQHLTGEALEEVKELHSEERDDIKLVSDTLKRAFRDTVPAHIVMGRFNTRRQGEDESVCLYALDLRRLLRRAHRQDPTCCLNPGKTLRDQFVEGLFDASLKLDLLRLIRQNPNCNFYDVTDKALAVAEAAGRTKRAPAQRLLVNCQRVVRRPSGPGALSYTTADQVALFQEVMELRRTLCNELDKLRIAVNGRASGVPNRLAGTPQTGRGGGATGYGYRPRVRHRYTAGRPTPPVPSRAPLHLPNIRQRLTTLQDLRNRTIQVELPRQTGRLRQRGATRGGSRSGQAPQGPDSRRQSGLDPASHSGHECSSWRCVIAAALEQPRRGQASQASAWARVLKAEQKVQHFSMSEEGRVGFPWAPQRERLVVPVGYEMVVSCIATTGQMVPRTPP
ncbi:hypothetical protein Bbelb_349530 [Branchiostoma belcheri]|nr:hypothetical protein Bbelb_349530 [Branchiostoma belcheri]